MGNQTAATEYSYGPARNELTEKREYDYTGTLLRRTRTDYVSQIEYVQRHIYALPALVEVFGADPARLVERTEYRYDGATLEAAPGAIQHDPRFDSASPQHEDWSRYRGNVTEVRRLANLNPGDMEIETRQYNCLGSRVLMSTGSRETRFRFLPESSYAFATERASGATDPASPLRIMTTATYDVAAGVKTSSTDENGRRTEYSWWYDPQDTFGCRA